MIDILAQHAEQLGYQFGKGLLAGLNAASGPAMIPSAKYRSTTAEALPPGAYKLKMTGGAVNKKGWAASFDVLCKTPGCTSPARAKGHCSKCYQAARRRTAKKITKEARLIPPAVKHSRKKFSRKARGAKVKKG